METVILAVLVSLLAVAIVGWIFGARQFKILHNIRTFQDKMWMVKRNSMYGSSTCWGTPQDLLNEITNLSKCLETVHKKLDLLEKQLGVKYVYHAPEFVYEKIAKENKDGSK